MAEDIKKPTKEELLASLAPVEETEQEVEVPEGEPEAPELSGVELEASKLGWTTKDQWVEAGRRAEDWRPADAWLDRGQILNTLAQVRQELKQTKAQVGAAYEQGKKIAEASYKDELDSLRASKKEALMEHDLVKADEIQEQIDAHKEKGIDLPEKKVIEDFTPPPEYNLFIDRNPWYLKDPLLKASADAAGAAFLERYGKTAKPADLYFFVESAMREKFGELAGGKKKAVGPATETGSNSNRGPGKGGLEKSLSALKSEMTDFERGIMKNVIATTPNMTEEKFLKDYAKIK